MSSANLMKPLYEEFEREYLRIARIWTKDDPDPEAASKAFKAVYPLLSTEDFLNPDKVCLKLVEVCHQLKDSDQMTRMAVERIYNKKFPPYLDWISFDCFLVKIEPILVEWPLHSRVI